MRPDVWVALPTGEAAGVAPLGGLQLVFALCRPPCQPPRAAAHVGGVGLWRPVWALCLECGAGRALSSRSRLSWLGEARAGLRSQSAGSSVPAPTGSAALRLCGSVALALIQKMDPVVWPVRSSLLLLEEGMERSCWLQCSCLSSEIFFQRTL